MANASLEHEARARQSQSEIPEILDHQSPNLAVMDDMLQAMTFSLTFTSSEWRLFWRLLNVGCMLADELLDLQANPNQTITGSSAVLWNELSAGNRSHFIMQLLQI